MYHFKLPVFTWFFKVETQSSINCCKLTPLSVKLKSKIFFMSSGCWKSNTFSFRSFESRTKSNRTSMTFFRNSAVSAPPFWFCGKMSAKFKIINFPDILWPRKLNKISFLDSKRAPKRYTLIELVKNDFLHDNFKPKQLIKWLLWEMGFF